MVNNVAVRQNQIFFLNVFHMKQAHQGCRVCSPLQPPAALVPSFCLFILQMTNFANLQESVDPSGNTNNKRSKASILVLEKWFWALKSSRNL